MINSGKRRNELRNLAIKIMTVIIFSFMLLYSCKQNNPFNEATDFTQHVNPFIGTGGTGHTFPGATFPFGFVQLSPNTGNWNWDYHSGYQYRDTTIRGFAHTHLSGGGGPMLGDVLVLPFSDGSALKNQCVAFSKESEKATPGYYSTYLTKDNIKIELSVTEHTGIHRYTFKNEGEGFLYINLDEVLLRTKNSELGVENAWLEIENDTVINGYQEVFTKGIYRNVWFTLQLNKPISGNRFLDEKQKRKIVLDFQFKKDEQLEMRVGLSGVGLEGAKENLREENLGFTFEEIVQKVQNEWNKYFSKIVIEGTLEQKEVFYTSMYHLFIQPNIISDVNGYYRGADDSVYQAPENGMYSTFAFWDTYRAANPLYKILIPDKMGTFVNSILRHYDEKGYLPVWSLWGKDTHVMIGNHSVPTIVDACLKGIPGINHDKAFEAIKTTLTKNWWRKYDWSVYDKYGYLPFDKVNAESVSRTLEATYDDWCAAQLANKLDRQDDYTFFINRSEFYKNLLDPETKMMRGKNSHGVWREPFNPLKIEHAGSTKGDYTEGNAWQYTWHVQHDITGLIDLMGGNEAFNSKLDTLFSMEPVKIGDGSTLDVSGLIGQYAHGNEPSQHVAYLYNYAGKPNKTQEMVHQIIHTLYNTTPEGYCGNNDFGQMSAWYIFSTLGFYPVNPVSGMFDIGTPAYEYARINLAGEPFIIEANNLSAENKYVKSVMLNGEPVLTYKISYSDIMQGGKLIFEMTNNAH